MTPEERKEKDRKRNRRWYAANREKKREYDRKWREANYVYYRQQQVLKAYGLTLEHIADMTAAQSGKCAICGIESKLHVDHCHSTGRVRGLLCGSCNRAIGLFKDNPVVMQSAARYVLG